MSDSAATRCPFCGVVKGRPHRDGCSTIPVSSAATVRLRLSQVTRFRVYLDGWRVNVYLTHWFYFSNRSYVTERRYFVRVGQWRKNFGPVRHA